MPSTILRRGSVLSLVAAALTTLTLAACGGDSSSDSTGTSSAGSSTEAMTEATTGASTAASTTSSGGSAPDGAQIFADTCASCHTLKAADSNGQVGPNLDDLKPDLATVEQQVTNGGGGMPAYKDSLSPEEIKAVAEYVSQNAGM
jgi:mono/diheme cytochrome c family protein